MAYNTGDVSVISKAREVPGVKSNSGPVESLLLSPPAASKLTGIGVTRIREAVRMGKIKAVLNGSHTRIFRESLLSYIANLPPYQKADYSRRRRGSTARGHR